MKRLFGQALSVGAVALLSVAVAPACAENDQSIFVRQVMAPPQNRQDGRCIYQADPSQPFISEGVVDAAARDTYLAELLVGSQFVPRGDQANTRAEPNRAHINGAVVRVTDPAGGVIGEFTSLGSGFVDPGQNNAASYGLAGITAIDPPTMAAAASGLEAGNTRLVIANIKVFGKTLGGVDVESAEFQFPIRVCNGCLISFALGDDPATAGRDCNRDLDTSSAGNVVLPCKPGQDEGTPCQLCRDRRACQGLP